MRETTVESYLNRRVSALGGISAKHVSPGRAGDPDRLVKLPGVPAALLELKRPGAALRPLQAARAREWAAAGMLCGWASTRDEVDAFLEVVLGQSRT